MHLQDQDKKSIRVLVVTNKRGLHARASSKFVKLVETFEAEIVVSRDGLSVHGNSIMGLMLLAAGPGSTIEVAATGPDAEAAIEAIAELLTDKFGEDE
ncbi:HPr family phosphocarrier protein [Oricola cellulosilytica]|uniref:HPr family phosphocarrier protein n=1 Tax=Oricola cellulosilytica TaxID=1429082 RepID=A0A4V2MPZ1_9HYPH|nr:HPr family phosphocarrier protein [Oricola cellulosilytica]TCD16022.1 HPr family phosphocarrier protein [Oricola cellulosilytica]